MIEILQQIDFTQITLSILIIIVSIITAICAKYFIPWLKTKFTDNQLTTIRVVVQALVQAAEQLYEDNDGEKKKIYVLELAQKELNAHNIKIDIDVLSAYIESEVLNLKNWLKK